MREGTERLLKQGEHHWRGQRAVNKRSKCIGGAREAVKTRKTARLGQGRLLKTGATVLGLGRLATTAGTGLEGPERLLTTGTTAFEGSGRLLTTVTTVLEGSWRLLTTRATALEGPESC